MTILCISPISIPNPNYGKKFKAGDPFSLKDCTSARISIPCGHCDECIAVKQMYLVQRVQMESLSHHVFFCTITYNNDMIPKLTTSLGYNIRYTDYHDLQNMFKRLRKNNSFGRPFRYLAVSERGSEKARPHAHILFFVKKEDTDTYADIISLEQNMFDSVLKEWSRNVGSHKKPLYKPCCTYIRKKIRGKWHTTYDLHYVYPTAEDSSCLNVAFYVLKYMLKSSHHDEALQKALKLNYDEDEYRDTWNIVKSRHIASKGFGLGVDSFSRQGLGDVDPKILKYIKECVSVSKSGVSEYPLFFNVSTGQSFPLSPYYKKRGDFYSMTDALSFYFNKRTDDLDSPIVPDDKDTDHQYGRLKYFHDSRAIHDLADELCDADLFDELFV